MRQRIFDMRGFDELEPTTFHEGNATPAQFEFEVKRMEARAKQDCNLVEGHAFFPELQDALPDKPRLIILALGFYEDGLEAFFSASEEILGVALFGLLNNLIGKVKNRLRAAVIFFKFDDLCRGEIGR